MIIMLILIRLENISFDRNINLFSALIKGFCANSNFWKMFLLGCPILRVIEI